ncbi:MAG: PilZ domain-containing protein [Myxococcales bacterium]|nr:PilZ domain-containing protein [Myxococcales bacterium]MCB9707585.1 PilZ domain-containing protein [Myxococcales bacterium]
MTLVCDGQEYEVVSRDLSLGGIFVVLDRPPPIGAKVVLRMSLPNLKETSFISATVRWHGDAGAGLRFDGLRAIEAWALNQLLSDE